MIARSSCPSDLCCQVTGLLDRYLKMYRPISGFSDSILLTRASMVGGLDGGSSRGPCHLSPSPFGISKAMERPNSTTIKNRESNVRRGDEAGFIWSNDSPPASASSTKIPFSLSLPL